MGNAAVSTKFEVFVDWDDLDLARGTFESALEEGEHEKDYWYRP